MIRVGNGWEQTPTTACISQGKRHVMSAGDNNFARVFLSTGRDGNCSVSQREGRWLFGVMAGWNGTCSMSRRDGTVIPNGGDSIGETGRCVTTVR